MRRQVLGFASVILSLGWPGASGVAFAHGGQYRGPHGEVPPDSRSPQDPPPPDNPSGTPTPPDVDGGTPTPDPEGGTPTPDPEGGTPDGSGGPGGDTPPGTGSGAGGGVKTGKGPARNGPSYDSWLFWWNYNKDEILDLRRSMRSGGAGSGAADLGEMAEGGYDNASEEQDVTAKAVEGRVVPLLKRYAADGKAHFDLRASGVLGLAKAGRRESIPLLMALARNEGAERCDPVVQETAALSLGVMQHRTREVREFLGGLAADAAAPVRTRCFAAFALGLLGDADGNGAGDAASVRVLRSLVESGEANRDVAASALLALGHLGDPSAVPDLVCWLREEKAGPARLNDLQLSCAAAALGKIGRPGFAGPGSREAVEALAHHLRRKNRLTRWSAVIALGQIGPRGDEKVQDHCVSILSDVVKAEGKVGSDAQAVRFALISLGRIAGAAPGADGRGGCPAATRERAVAVLLRAFDDKAAIRPFAALGLGLAGMRRNESERAPLAGRIRETLARSNGDVEQRGALVLAVGMLGDLPSVGALRAILDDRSVEKRLRGTAAVALGLIGDSGAVESVRRSLAERDDGALRADVAVAAGLLRDAAAVGILVDILKDPRSSQYLLGSAATALGQIGDQRAVEPLVRLVEDAEAPNLTRALACVALGRIADRGDLPVLSRVSKDVNYRAYYDALGELLTIL